jgi:hypothetical protein
MFLEFWDREIWYKTFNLYVFIFLWLQSLDIWKIQWVFHLIFAAIKTKTNWLASTLQPFSRFWKNQYWHRNKINLIWKHEYSAFMSRRYKGVALSWRGPHPPPLKFLIIFLSEVVEAIWGWWNKKWLFHIKSPYLRIPKIIDFWLECH